MTRPRLRGRLRAGGVGVRSGRRRAGRRVLSRHVSRRFGASSRGGGSGITDARSGSGFVVTLRRASVRHRHPSGGRLCCDRKHARRQHPVRQTLPPNEIGRPQVAQFRHLAYFHVGQRAVLLAVAGQKPLVGLLLLGHGSQLGSRSCFVIRGSLAYSAPVPADADGYRVIRRGPIRTPPHYPGSLACESRFAFRAPVWGLNDDVAAQPWQTEGGDARFPQFDGRYSGSTGTL